MLNDYIIFLIIEQSQLIKFISLAPVGMDKFQGQFKKRYWVGVGKQFCSELVKKKKKV